MGDNNEWDKSPDLSLWRHIIHLATKILITENKAGTIDLPIQ